MFTETEFHTICVVTNVIFLIYLYQRWTFPEHVASLISLVGIRVVYLHKLCSVYMSIHFFVKDVMRLTLIVYPLQVQSEHFKELFSPKLGKHGYQALFKKKIAEFYNGSNQTLNGCATFFRRDRISHVKKYEGNTPVNFLFVPPCIPTTSSDMIQSGSM